MSPTSSVILQTLLSNRTEGTLFFQILQNPHIYSNITFLDILSILLLASFQILGTFGKVQVIGEAITNMAVDQNGNAYSSDTLHIDNFGDRAIEGNQLNSQPYALSYLQKVSKKVFTSTIKTLFDTNNSSGRGVFDSITNNNVRSNYSELITNFTNISTTSEKSESVYTPHSISNITSYAGPTVCVNGTGIPVAPAPTNLSEIPAKEIIIVLLMLSLWLYSINMTRRAWKRLLKE